MYFFSSVLFVLLVVLDCFGHDLFLRLDDIVALLELSDVCCRDCSQACSDDRIRVVYYSHIPLDRGVKLELVLSFVEDYVSLVPDVVDYCERERRHESLTTSEDVAPVLLSVVSCWWAASGGIDLV